MVSMPIVGFIFTLLGVAIAGAVGGFFLARFLIKRELQKNPPISEKQIRAMYEQMGRKPSEKQIRAIMNSVKNNK